MTQFKYNRLLNRLQAAFTKLEAKHPDSWRLIGELGERWYKWAITPRRYS